MLLGDSGVGKTCFLIRFRDGAFLSGTFIATVGIDFRVRWLQAPPPSGEPGVTASGTGGMGGLSSPPCRDPSGLQWLTLEVANLEASGLVGLPAPHRMRNERLHLRILPLSRADTPHTPHAASRPLGQDVRSAPGLSGAQGSTAEQEVGELDWSYGERAAASILPPHRGEPILGWHQQIGIRVAERSERHTAPGARRAQA